MAPDEDDDERWSPGPLLPPDDRLWRHPSELAAPPGPLGRAPAPPAPDAGEAAPRWRHPILAGAAIGCVILALGVVLLQGGDPEPGPESASRLDEVALAGGDERRAAVPSTDVAVHLAPDSVASVELVHLDGSTHLVSAVWLDHHGLLVTGAIEATATQLILVRGDRRTVQAARLVGLDPGTGLAVLDVADTDGSPAELAGRQLDPGPAVVATGSGTVHPVEVTDRGVIAAEPLGSDAIGGALIGPNGTVAAVVVATDDGTIATASARALQQAVERVAQPATGPAALHGG